MTLVTIKRFAYLSQYTELLISDLACTLIGVPPGLPLASGRRPDVTWIA